MWRKSKTKNRRLHRGHVLDVKLRSDQVRATRMRLATIAATVFFGTVFGLFLMWRTGEWALDRFVYENSAFAIQNIEVQTDGVIPPDELRRWSNVRPGANLIALDLAAVKRNLELVPEISGVWVERVLPRTLRIRVTERRPVAQVNVPTATRSGGIVLTVFQLDADGYVMKPLDPRQQVIPLSQLAGQLPAITGLNQYLLLPGHRVDSPEVLAALRLVTAFRHSPMAGLVDLWRVDVSQPGVVVALTKQGSEITFGFDNLDQQLGRWREIHDWGQTMNKVIATANLAVSNNVPVRWMAAAGQPEASPENSKPTHIRRRNV